MSSNVEKVDTTDNENEKQGEVLDENENDENFEVKKARKKRGDDREKIDVMGKISLTCDAMNISVRDRTVISATVANALGVDLDKTNINQTTAWRKGKEVRLEKAKDIIASYTCPDKVVVHWDGKTFKLRGRIESKRVCIFISGVDEEKTRKLLGIPETESGRGVDEFEMVKEYLVKWKVKEQIVGMVFDTTASNSGEHSGACRYLEVWVDTPILWLACCRASHRVSYEGYHGDH